ncbi:hypothetical protein [Senegalia massiliensis]|uniref:hypothetical protein n=1 Tax=Senegalia massiliensis TaxID=1720316 RepID=UPI00102F52FB|nr:hypothetical protein [Senegalia massiliensis]
MKKIILLLFISVIMVIFISCDQETNIENNIKDEASKTMPKGVEQEKNIDIKNVDRIEIINSKNNFKKYVASDEEVQDIINAYNKSMIDDINLEEGEMKFKILIFFKDNSKRVIIGFENEEEKVKQTGYDYNVLIAPELIKLMNK